MRITRKILAFVLAMLMIVGALPVTVLAAAVNSVANSGSVVDTNKKPSSGIAGENQTLDEYLEANGGTMIFGTSFDDESKVTAGVDEGKIASSMGGKGYMTRSYGSFAGGGEAAIDFVNGYLRLTTPETKPADWPDDTNWCDVYPRLYSGIGKSENNGEFVVVDVTLSINKAFTGTLSLMTVCDSGPAASGSGSLRSDFTMLSLTGNATTGKIALVMANTGVTLYEFAVGEQVRISAFIDPVTYAVNAFANGEYVGSGMIKHQGNKGFGIFYNGQRADVKYPSFNSDVRILQISGRTNMDLSLYDLKMYNGVSKPHLTKGGPDMSYLEGLGEIGANVKYYNNFDNVEPDMNATADPNVFNATYNTGADTNIALTRYLGDRTQVNQHSKARGLKYQQIFEGTNGFHRSLGSANDKHDYLQFNSLNYNMAKDGVLAFQIEVRGVYSSARNIQFSLQGASETELRKDTVLVSLSTNSITAGDGTQIGQLALNKFTTITVLVDTANNRYSVAVDGYVAVEDLKLIDEDASFAKLKQISFIRYNFNGAKTNAQYIDTDNMLVYSYKVGSDQDYKTMFAGYNGKFKVDTPVNKWVQLDDGAWRYYGANGFYLTGNQTLNGNAYRFDNDGCYVEAERDWLIGFDNLNGAGKTMFGRPKADGTYTDYLDSALEHTGSSTDGRKWNYSALLVHAYYEGYEQGKTPDNYAYSGSARTNLYFPASREFVNPKYARKTTQADIDALGGWKSSVTIKAGTEYTVSNTKYKLKADQVVEFPDSMKRKAGVDTIFDFGDYTEVEFRYYAENLSGYWPKVILNNLQYDVRTKVTTTKLENGDYKYVTDLRTGYARLDNFKFVDADGNNLPEVNGSFTYTIPVSSFKGCTTEIGFQGTWDGGTKRGDYSKMLFYFQEINLVKYVKYTGDAVPEPVRTNENGDTVVYSNGSTAYGMVTVNGATYYCDSFGVAYEGVITIGDQTFVFGEDGKLIEDAAGKLLIINGTKYYVQEDGTVGHGKFSVGGVKFTTNAKGVVTVDGDLPYIKYREYTATTPGTLNSGSSMLYYVDFQSEPTENPPAGTKPTKGTGTFRDRNVPYFGEYRSQLTVDIVSNKTTIPAGVRFFGVIRNTRWYNVKEADGNVALLTYNMDKRSDPYVDIQLTGDKRVFNATYEASFKLGEGWNAEATLLSVQDRDGKNVQIPAVTVNQNGYIMFDKHIIGQLRTDEYTKISIQIRSDNAGVNRGYEIFLNDCKVVNFTKLNAAYVSATQIRVMQYFTNNVGHGEMYVDNLAAYTGNKYPYSASEIQQEAGPVPSGDFTRYSAGWGKLKYSTWFTGTDGEYYYNEHGIRVTDSGFYDGFYLVDGAKQPYVGEVKIGDDYYFFNTDYTVHAKVENKMIDPYNVDYAFDIDETGKITAKYFRGKITSVGANDYLGVLDALGNPNTGNSVFDKELGVNLYDPNGNPVTIVNYGDITDITNYSFLNVGVKGVAGGKYTITFGYTTVYEINGYELTNGEYTDKQVSTVDRTDILLKDLTKDERNENVYFLEVEGVKHYFEVTHQIFGESVSYNMSAGWGTLDIPLTNYATELLASVEFVNITLSDGALLGNVGFIQYDADVEGDLAQGWDGDSYFVDGRPLKGWQNIANDGRWYYFDVNTGAKVTGLAKLPKKPADDIAPVADEMLYYVFSDAGILDSEANGFIDTTSYIYNAEKGEYEEVTVSRVFKDGQLVSGKYEAADGNTYYVDDENHTVIKDSVLDLDGDGFPETYVNADGIVTLVSNKWITDDNGDLYYLGANGQVIKGYHALNVAPDGTVLSESRYYFFDEEGRLVKNSFVDIDGDGEAETYMDANGTAANGIVENATLFVNAFENKMYFVNGRVARTEVLVDVEDNGTKVTYLYKFDINGECTGREVVASDGLKVLIKVVKDGNTESFVFDIVDGKFEKTDKPFEGYNCYYIIIKDEATGKIIAQGDAHQSLAFPTDIVFDASATYSVTYVSVEHDYQLSDLSYDPTCITPGKNVYMCTICGDNYYDIVPATGVHAFDDAHGVVVVEPTCWRAGLIEYTCDCGAVSTEEIAIDPDAHPNAQITYTKDINGDGVIDDKDGPTCTVGTTAYVECPYCKLFEHQDIAPIPHKIADDAVWSVMTPATCIDKGVYVTYCEYGCGYEFYKDIPVDEANHPHMDLLNKGIDELTGEPNRYHYTDEERATLAANFSVFKVLTVNNCTVNGIATYRCLNCGDFIDGALPTNEDYSGHVWDEGVVSEVDQVKNCGESVERIHKCIYECKDENDEFVTKSTWDAANNNHDFDFNVWYTVDDVNHPLFGYHYNLCKNCAREINVTKHVFAPDAYNGDGTHTRVCTCYVYEISKDADGYYVITAEADNYSETDPCVLEEVPTSDNAGKHTYFCEVCNGGVITEDCTIVTGPHGNSVHAHYCDTCDWVAFEAPALDPANVNNNWHYVPAADSTCADMGYDAYYYCTFDGCTFETEHEFYATLDHKYSADSLCSDGTTHWYACERPGCDVKLFEESHIWEEIVAVAATCTSDGYNAHVRCEICMHVQAGSVKGANGATLSDDQAKINAFNHSYEDVYYFNDDTHWRFCTNVIILLDGTSYVCTHRDEAAHTYSVNFGDYTNYTDYDDEFGTGYRKCDTCEYHQETDTLPTWWGNLGLKLEVLEDGSRRYYLEIDGERKTDYIAVLTDAISQVSGIYYFDDNGYLVMNGDWTGEGTATNANPFTESDKFNTVTTIADRGAITDAIIDTVDSVLLIQNGEFCVGWQTLADGREYFFYDPAIESTTDVYKDVVRVGALLRGESTIYAWAYDKTTKAHNDTVILCNVDAEGAHLLGVVEIDGKPYFYLDGYAGKMTGRIEDTYYCASDAAYSDIYFTDEQGVLYTGDHIAINGVYYSFGGLRANADGTTTQVANAYVRSAWHINEHFEKDINDDGVVDQIYTDGEGKRIHTGWFLAIGIGGHYIENYDIVVNAEAKEIDGVWYDITNTVVAYRTNWIVLVDDAGVDQDAYVVEGMLVTERFEIIDGNNYFFDVDGYLVKNTGSSAMVVYIGTSPYVIGADGIATLDVTNDNWVIFVVDGKVDATKVGYYNHTTGLARDIQQIGQDYYYFDENGYMIVDTKYYDGRSDKYYHFDETGKGTVITKEEYEMLSL